MSDLVVGTISRLCFVHRLVSQAEGHLLLKTDANQTKPSEPFCKKYNLT